jgi:hypothetical protein
VGALASLWCGAKGKLADISQNAIPRLRSGLHLSRCGKSWRSSNITIEGNDKYVHDVKIDLDSLNEGGQGKGLLGEFISKNWWIGIKEGQHSFQRGEILYKPGDTVPQDCISMSIPNWTSEKWPNVPSWIYLFHEFVHAYDYKTGNSGTASTSECRAVGLGKYCCSTKYKYNENKLRCERGELIRPCYNLAAQPCGTAKIPETIKYDAPICRDRKLVRVTSLEEYRKMMK